MSYRCGGRVPSVVVCTRVQGSPQRSSVVDRTAHALLLSPRLRAHRGRGRGDRCGRAATVRRPHDRSESHSRIRDKAAAIRWLPCPCKGAAAATRGPTDPFRRGRAQSIAATR